MEAFSLLSEPRLLARTHRLRALFYLCLLLLRDETKNRKKEKKRKRAEIEKSTQLLSFLFFRRSDVTGKKPLKMSAAFILGFIFNRNIASKQISLNY